MHDHPADDAAPAVVTSRAGSAAPLLVGAAAASLGAGLVHAAAAGTHAGADSLVRLFAACAAVQVAAAALLLLRPGRVVLAGAALLNGAAAVAWLVSRNRGLPWPAELEGVEEVGTQDAIAAALGAAAATAALLALLRPRLRAPRLGPAHPLSLVAGLAVPGMATSHAHGGHDDHGGHAEGEVAGEGHGHVEADVVALGTGPIISVEDPRVSEEQRAAATELIETTRAAIAAYGDPAAVEAAGYLSIGDAPTGYEHYINVGHIADGIDLDPTRIESVVYTVAADGTRTLASGMYILGFGATMASVPEIAGGLTTWHDHQNLCWEGARVVGTTDRTGSCERGEFRPTPPMLHVWVTEHPCGPFAGIEGAHGSGCEHGH